MYNNVKILHPGWIWTRNLLVWRRRDDHYAKPPGLMFFNMLHVLNCLCGLYVKRNRGIGWKSIFLIMFYLKLMTSLAFSAKKPSTLPAGDDLIKPDET
jgi:hypothetical protein